MDILVLYDLRAKYNKIHNDNLVLYEAMNEEFLKEIENNNLQDAVQLAAQMFSIVAKGAFSEGVVHAVDLFISEGGRLN